MRSYGAARSLFSVISFFSWFLIIGGIILIYTGAEMGVDLAHWNRTPEVVGLILGVIPGLGMTLFGFFALVTAQIGRAGVDSAEYGQQMLQIARDHLEISRQTLHKGDTPRLTFEALTQSQSDTGSASYAGHLSQAGTDSVATVSPPNSASAPSLIAYKGKEIAALEQGFHFAGTAFATLSEAQSHIDQLVPEAALARGPLPGTA